MLACQSNCLILAKILFNAFNVHDVDYVKLVILYLPLVLFFFFFWGISFLKTCIAFHKACQYLELLLLSLIYIQISFGSFLQDGDQGDDDLDDDGPREADLEGRVEKYIGVKVKACIFLCETWKGQG